MDRRGHHEAVTDTRDHGFSTDWFTMRDQKGLEWMLGDTNAYSFIRALMQIIEAWDDCIDQDQPHSPDQINEAFTLALIGLPNNPFYERHKSVLMPLMVLCANAYQDSNRLAESGETKHRNLAFHLRNMALEFYPLCAFLVGGWDHMRKVSPEIREFFAFESFEEYDNG